MNPLRQIPLFASLDEKAFEKLDAMTRRQTYPKGAILFFEGEMPDTVTILTRGRLKLFKTTSSDKEIVLHHFTPVTFVAEMALLQQIPYPATALFEEEGEVLSIEYERFETEFLNDPQLSRLLILSLSKKVKMLESVIDRGLVMDAAERVMNLLKSSPHLFETMRHYELANLLNLTPETFSRVLKRLHENGEVLKEEGNWRLRDDGR